MNMLCYFCKEEIEFKSASEEEMKLYVTNNNSPRWRHVVTGAVACKCVATPSDILVE